MKALKYLTDADLIACTHMALDDVSYYNAGLDYPDEARREHNARMRTTRQVGALITEATERHLTIANRGYRHMDSRLGPDDGVRS